MMLVEERELKEVLLAGESGRVNLSKLKAKRTIINQVGSDRCAEFKSQTEPLLMLISLIVGRVVK